MTEVLRPLECAQSRGPNCGNPAGRVVHHHQLRSNLQKGVLQNLTVEPLGKAAETSQRLSLFLQPRICALLVMADGAVQQDSDRRTPVAEVVGPRPVAGRSPSGAEEGPRLAPEADSRNVVDAVEVADAADSLAARDAAQTWHPEAGTPPDFLVLPLRMRETNLLEPPHVPALAAAFGQQRP